MCYLSAPDCLLWLSVHRRRNEAKPTNIQGIADIPPPQTSNSFNISLGIINVMQLFVPHMLHHTAPLWEFCKKNICMGWCDQSSLSLTKGPHGSAFQKPLWYYDHSKTISIQADTSSRCLNACLLKEGQSIAIIPRLRHRGLLSKHRTGVASSFIWLWKVSYLPLQVIIFSWKWTQVVGGNNNGTNLSICQATMNSSVIAAI